jgi:hypothetical protein
MKKLSGLLVLMLGSLLLAGCEDIFTENKDDDNDVTFLNRSTYNVTVSPTAQAGWSSFRLAPGERKKLSDIRDVYFVYEPRYRVDVGENDGGRIVFINLNENTVQADNNSN